MRTATVSLFLSLLPCAAAFGVQSDPTELARAEQTATSLLSERIPGLSEASLQEARSVLLLDEPGDGTVWARGSNWKASFGPSGFEYTPFLGPDAPRNFPVRMQLSGVTLGGETLAFAAAPTPSLVGSSVALDRSTLREVYHLNYETLEQTFVFDTLPGTGELRLAIETDSELAMSRDGAGWRFSHQRGEVRYGAATAVDANGQRLELEQVRTRTGFEIIVPSEFVESAALPLTVDPIIGTYQIVLNATREVDADIAYDQRNDVFMIVVEDSFSILDHDVISLFFRPSLNAFSAVRGIDISNDRWDCPRIANCWLRETFLCVAAKGSALGSREIWGRTRRADTGTRGAQFEVSSGSGDHSEPDVGGYANDTSPAESFCVVWQRSNTLPLTEFDVVSQSISHLSARVGPVVNIANINGQSDARPSISQTSGRVALTAAAHQYMVVWEREESSTNRDVWARVVDFDNDVTGHSRFRAYSFSDALDPDVSVQRTNFDISPDPFYVIVFERLVGSDYDIFAVVADDGDADNARNITAMQDVAIQDEQADPHIAFDGDDFLVTYGTEGAGNGLDIYYTTLNVVSDGVELRTGLSERRTPLRNQNGSLRSNAITSTSTSGSGGGGTAMSVWTAGAAGGTGGILGAAVLEERSLDIVGSQYCAANENAGGASAWIRAAAPRQTGATNLQLRCFDLPTQQFGIFLASRGNSVTPNAGGSAGNLCLSGGIGRINVSVGNSGATGRREYNLNLNAVPTPGGTSATLPGETWFFQYWTRDVQNGMATSNYSNAIGVTFL